MTYRLELRPAARRDLKRLPREMLARIDAHILALADNPRPTGAEKLKGATDTYRIRVGDYRILYEIQDTVLIVFVIRIRHRREVYRT